MSIAAEAYNATKLTGDPDFYGTPAEYRSELEFRAEAVIRTGVTTNNFEEKVKELNDKAKSDIDTPLGTKNTIEESRNQTTEPSDEKPLSKMSRAELDEIAVKEFGFNPSDYSNKEEIVAAIEEARAK